MWVRTVAGPYQTKTSLFYNAQPKNGKFAGTIGIEENRKQKMNCKMLIFFLRRFEVIVQLSVGCIHRINKSAVVLTIRAVQYQFSFFWWKKRSKWDCEWINGIRYTYTDAVYVHFEIYEWIACWLRSYELMNYNFFSVFFLLLPR